MQFYSLTASRGSLPARTCAMYPAMSLDEAAKYAEILKNSGHLGYVEYGSEYAVRASSRRETDLLQRFLASCNRTATNMHIEQDFDGLLNRRQSLLLTFFMALYLAPEKIRDMVNNPAGGVTKATPGGTTGGGGAEIVNEPPAEVEPIETAPSSTDAKDDATSEILEDSPEEADAPIDNSSQEGALAALLNSAEANDGGKSRDRQVDLGDEDFF